ncbi:SURF1 family cytochrome oxidase biogenesis protein [Cellulomonas edaphi]|uniref:SURF1-like protein n=1 Tax=Cellulomonas edaphi TaxID=3053468 RepID=A0ABT7S5R5_9CELL|nr:SURF1 family protein [Cellulomons edaphi]MDM7830953.1 SURF1 family protein [Cellulomons edaphi]
MSPALRRAVGLCLLAVALATACVFLGRWQWNRHTYRDAQIAIVNENFGADPVPLSTVLTPDQPLAGDQVWRPVLVTGHYEPDRTVELRNRPADGIPAYHVLVPFVVDDSSAGTAATPTDAGTVLVVDRGWVATGEDASADVVAPAPPAGDVTITVRLRASEPDSRRKAPPGQVQAIAVDEVLDVAGIDAPTWQVYGGLESESPAPADVPGTLPEPSTDPGSHLSYAFQWWVFALGSLVGFTWMARRELREAADQERVPADRAPRKPRRKEGRAEADEDALVDAQLAQSSGDGAGRAR